MKIEERNTKQKRINIKNGIGTNLHFRYIHKGLVIKLDIKTFLT